MEQPIAFFFRTDTVLFNLLIFFVNVPAFHIDRFCVESTTHLSSLIVLTEGGWPDPAESPPTAPGHLALAVDHRLRHQPLHGRERRQRAADQRHHVLRPLARAGANPLGARHRGAEEGDGGAAGVFRGVLRGNAHTVRIDILLIKHNLK